MPSWLRTAWSVQCRSDHCGRQVQRRISWSEIRHRRIGRRCFNPPTGWAKPSCSLPQGAHSVRNTSLEYPIGVRTTGLSTIASLCIDRSLVPTYIASMKLPLRPCKLGDNLGAMTLLRQHDRSPSVLPNFFPFILGRIVSGEVIIINSEKIFNLLLK